MLRVLPLELLFYFGIRFDPESLQALGYLNRAVIGCEDLDDQRNAPGGDLKFVVHTVEVLDASA